MEKVREKLEEGDAISETGERRGEDRNNEIEG